MLIGARSRDEQVGSFHSPPQGNERARALDGLEPADEQEERARVGRRTGLLPFVIDAVGEIGENRERLGKPSLFVNCFSKSGWA